MKASCNLFLMGMTSVFLLFSCDSFLEENNNPVSISSIQADILAMGYSVDTPLVVLNDLKDIPVYIYLPEGAGGVGKKYLSASNKDGGIRFVDEDSGSGRERWFLIQTGSNRYNTNRFALKTQGGSFGRYVTFMLDSNGKYTYIYMQNNELPLYDNESVDWRIVPVDNKFLIQSFFVKDAWITSFYFGQNIVGLVRGSEPRNDLSCRFSIEPVAEFLLDDVEYTSKANSDQVAGEIVYLKSYPLINNSSYPVTQVIQATTNYQEKSTFSETAGMSVQNTIKVGAEFTLGVPHIVDIVGMSASISYTKSTTRTSQYTTGEEQTESYTFSRTLTQEIPPHSSLYMWIKAKKFEFGTGYLGHFSNSKLGKSIRLSGDWSGKQYYEVGVELSDVEGNILGEYNTNSEFIPSRENRKIDIAYANKLIMENAY